MDALAAAIRDGAPDPIDAANRYQRIRERALGAGIDPAALGEDGALILQIACQRAPYLATLLARDPERLVRVTRDGYLRREKPREVLDAELRALRTPDRDADLHRLLRRLRGDEMVRLGVREIALGTPTEVGRELSRLADASFAVALEHHLGELSKEGGPPRFVDAAGAIEPAQFAVIGMGKLGGEELNFCSDVDVIYVYNSDQSAPGPLSLHEFYARLAERVTAALAEVTEEDVVFRVDLRLRPEGSRGAIVNSLPSLERYYETWGRPWERQAWLKARHVAGDTALSEEVFATLAPFIYPRTLSPARIEEVRDLNRKIKAEEGTSIERGFNVKNGVGGIREIEFFVQALQLVHAGRLPALRARSTRTALDRLLFAGIITESERAALADAYTFLRRVEHMLQLDSGRQTQRLPSQEPELDRFARRLGYADSSSFQSALRERTGVVARLFATLGDDSEGPADPVISLLDSAERPKRERRLLEELGFRDPGHAQELLAAARKRADSPLSPAAGGAVARVGRAIFEEITHSPDPDQALSYLVDLIRRRGAWSAVWRLLDENPPVLRLVASLFGTSAYLSRQFIDHPELIDGLLLAGQASPRVAEAALEQHLSVQLAGLSQDEDRWNAMAEWKNGQVLRIGLADIAGELGPREVSAELSRVAEICLRHALELVSEGLRLRHGTPRDSEGRPVGLAILALGKLGGGELGYASDLDVIFVYSADGESDGARPLDNVTYMSRLAQRVMGGLHTRHDAGRLYDIDTRLRPSGTHGLLVSSLPAWQRYHRENAMLWERQALTKLRPIAGDPELCRRVQAVAHDCVYGSAPGVDGRESQAEIARQIHAMRERIESELGGSVRGFDVKVGRGGLVDIEFAAQYLQLTHGHALPELRTQKTTAVLSAAAELGVAPPELCSLLCQAYDFIRRLEHRMRIVHDRAVHRLPEDPDELMKLARRAGFPDASALQNAFGNWTRSVRAAYQSLLQSAVPSP